MTAKARRNQRSQMLSNKLYVISLLANMSDMNTTNGVRYLKLIHPCISNTTQDLNVLKWNKMLPRTLVTVPKCRAVVVYPKEGSLFWCFVNISFATELTTPISGKWLPLWNAKLSSETIPLVCLEPYDLWHFCLTYS